VDVYEAVTSRRTTRRFRQEALDRGMLTKLINAARLAPSASNLQPCEYIVVDDPQVANDVFHTLKWAKYIAPEGDPKEGERPVAYIVVLLNGKKREDGGEVDAAAAIENILLTAYGEGIGSCWLGSIDRGHLANILHVPEHCKIDSVVALGYLAEKPLLEVMVESVKYWKDEHGILHVPKRKLQDILHYNEY
jgi:nitroreductase